MLQPLASCLIMFHLQSGHLQAPVGFKGLGSCTARGWSREEKGPWALLPGMPSACCWWLFGPLVSVGVGCLCSISEAGAPGVYLEVGGGQGSQCQRKDSVDHMGDKGGITSLRRVWRSGLKVLLSKQGVCHLAGGLEGSRAECKAHVQDARPRGSGRWIFPSPS